MVLSAEYFLFVSVRVISWIVLVAQRQANDPRTDTNPHEMKFLKMTE